MHLAKGYAKFLMFNSTTMIVMRENNNEGPNKNIFHPKSKSGSKAVSTVWVPIRRLSTNQRDMN